MMGRLPSKGQKVRPRRRVAVLFFCLSSIVASLLFVLHQLQLFPFSESEKATTMEGELKEGESLSSSLQSQGLSPHLIASLIQNLRPLVDFRRSQPKDRYRLVLDGKGEFRSFLYQMGLLESYEIERVGERWETRKRIRSLKGRQELVEGVVEASLFEDMERIGEQPGLAIDFAQIFLWDIDFHTDPRVNDRFRMIVEKLYLDEQFVKYGKIFVAQYENRGRTFTGICFQDGKGHEDYYSPDGTSLRKALLRSPLQFNRITSKYTRSRLHPILGGYRPHLAVDYAAPHGTPVWAVADGWVKRCGWSGGNGNCIVLVHRNGFSSFYNHLSRFAARIRKGVRVKQRQIIGYVGSTGCSTGPHLDYRLQKDGSFINPLRKIMLPGTPVAKADRSRFYQVRDELMGQLERTNLRQPSCEPFEEFVPQSF
jgi:murein DD-endopeptidase MepM/ murein hydrolase activator NlpD